MISLLFITISFIIASSVKVVAINIYESLNIDAAQKQQFKNEIIKDSFFQLSIFLLEIIQNIFFQEKPILNVSWMPSMLVLTLK